MSTDGAGAPKASVAYYPYGATRSSSGTLGTDRKYTGQRLDLTGLYYYGARYYDASLGRFLSPDSYVQHRSGLSLASTALTVNLDRSAYAANLDAVSAPPLNPQTLHRYSYVLNSPLTYVDPYGLWTFQITIGLSLLDGYHVSVGQEARGAPSEVAGRWSTFFTREAEYSLRVSRPRVFLDT